MIMTQNDEMSPLFYSNFLNIILVGNFFFPTMQFGNRIYFLRYVQRLLHLYWQIRKNSRERIDRKGWERETERQTERQTDRQRQRQGHLSPEVLCILEAFSAGLAYLTLQPEGSFCVILHLHEGRKPPTQLTGHKAEANVHNSRFLPSPFALHFCLQMSTFAIPF